MNNRDLTTLLRPSDSATAGQAPECPDENWAAAYVDGTLEPARREEFQQHLADCDSCLSLVGLLSHDREAGVPEPVPETTVARARSLLKRARPGWTRYLPQVAAAAAVLIAIPVLMQIARPPGADLSPQNAVAKRSTRAASPAGSPAPQVLSPTAGATVEPDRLTVRWSAVPGSDYYDVRILEVTGVLVTEQRVTGTEWVLEDDSGLSPGTEYFVQVDAYPSDGKARASKHVPFRTGD